jgi:malate-CoA ligase subunit beta
MAAWRSRSSRRDQTLTASCGWSSTPPPASCEFQARELAFRLGLEGKQVGADGHLVLRACYRAYRDLDAMMVEINPLVITGAGDLVALDAKMSFDTNALFRRPQVAALRDPGQEDAREAVAADNGLAYVGLDGDIGCIINGAGLAMATMDMIKLAGRRARELPRHRRRRLARACRARPSARCCRTPNVSVILVNIFAGINRCDWIAKGVVQAYKEVGLVASPWSSACRAPMSRKGARSCAESGLPIISADTLAEAPNAAVARPARNPQRPESPEETKDGNSHHRNHPRPRAGHVRPHRPVPHPGDDRGGHQRRRRRHARARAARRC